MRTLAKRYQSNESSISRGMLIIIFTILCSVAILLSARSTYAASSSWTEGNYTFQFTNSGTAVKSYSGNEKVPSIPQKTKNGYTVTEIGSNVFKNKQITGVKIPSTVRIIGYSAFYGCSSLRSVNLPSSLTELGSNAFSKSGITTVKIPKSLAEVGNYGPFSNCSDLRSASVEKGMKAIPKYLFKDCKSLQNVTLPTGINVIGYEAFYCCSNLTEVQIPDSVQQIGSYAFNQCSALQNVNLPSSLTELGSYAFSKTSITTVKIPKSLAEVGNYGPFSNCSDLRSASVEKGMKAIPKYLFKDCKSLQNVTLPTGINVIGYEAFYCCSNLTEVQIPDSVQQIGSYAFNQCSALQNVNLPSSLTELGSYAFSKTSITTVKIPKTLADAGNYGPFSNCSDLRSASVEKGAKVVPAYLFKNCKALQSITIPADINEIGYEAFYNCSNLSSVKYEGSKDVWECVTIKKYNDALSSAAKSYGKEIPTWYSSIYKNHSVKDNSKANTNSNAGSNSPKTKPSTKKTVNTAEKQARYAAAKKSASILKVRGLKAKVKKRRNIKVSWKTNKFADGYQIQYSRSRKFTKKGKTKTVFIRNKATGSYTIRKLKRHKKYYVRIRPYKTVVRPNGSSELVYGKWTKKRAKTK